MHNFKILCALICALSIHLPAWADDDLGYDSRHPLFNGFLSDETSKPVNLQRYRGNVVFLVFWASWCQRCIKQMKILDNLYSSAADKNIIFLPINMDFRGIPLVKKSYAGFKITKLRAVVDNAGKASKYLKVSILPTTIVIDENGITRKRIVGQRTWNVSYINGIISDIKAQQKNERSQKIEDLKITNRNLIEKK